MLKYRGTYRVLYETDKQGRVCEFTYIPCRIKKGSDIYRYNDNTLTVYITSGRIITGLLATYPDLFKPHQIGDSEGTLVFPESRMMEAAIILKAATRGKNMPAKPKRTVTFSDEHKRFLSDRMKNMHKVKSSG